MSSRIADFSRPLASPGVDGHDDLQPRHSEQPGHGHLRVDRPEPPAGAARGADHDRRGAFLVREVPVLRRLVDQAVHDEREEVREHDLDDGPQARDRASVRSAGQGELRDRRVDHTMGAVLLEQPGRDREDTAGHGDVLADEHHALVALQLLVERLPQGVTELELRHAENNNPPCQAVLNVSTIARWRSRLRSAPVRRSARPPLEEDVGPRLRAYREQRGLSLRELARRLGVSPSAISQIETGKSRPSVSTLYSIVSELGMSLDELFGAPKPAQPAAAPTAGNSRSTAAAWSEAGGTARPAGRQPRDDRPRVGRPLGTADAGPGPRPGLPLRHLRRRRILERRQPVDPPLGPRVRADPQRHARGRRSASTTTSSARATRSRSTPRCRTI